MIQYASNDTYTLLTNSQLLGGGKKAEVIFLTHIESETV